MDKFLQPMCFFADRDTLQEASEYVTTLGLSLPPADRIALYTAAFVLYNTAAKLANARIAELEEALGEKDKTHE